MVDSTLESSWTPINELHSTLGLNCCNCLVNILWNNISSVHQTCRHVSSMGWITLGHHTWRLKNTVGNLSNRKWFMECLFSRDNWRIRSQHKVNSRVWYQVSLEFSNINIKGSIESKGCSEGWNNLSNKSVQVSVSWSLNIQFSLAHIIKCFIVKTECNISMLQKSMGWENRVIWLNYGGRNFRRRGNSKWQLGLSTVINGETFKKKGSETRSSSSSSSMEYQESLKTSTLIRQFTNTVKYTINDLFTNGVMSSGIVVCCIFLAWNDLLRVVELTVSTSSYFITHSRFEIYVDCTRNVLAILGFAEECVEGVVLLSNWFITRHHSFWVNSMLKTVELPTSVSSLDTCLSDVYWDTFYLSS